MSDRLEYCKWCGCQLTRCVDPEHGTARCRPCGGITPGTERDLMTALEKSLQRSNPVGGKR